MNVQLLNFLKEVPLKNWFNYFVDPKAFKAEVINAKDASLAGQLLDQFIENALGAVNDVRSSKTKKKDPGADHLQLALSKDDILFAEEKSDKLWNFAWACAAQMEWNLEAMLKHSNEIKVYSMIVRLFEKTFGVSDESDVLAYLLQLENNAFNSKNLFVVWMYARLVILIDTKARTPLPPVMPTVSNPQNQIDLALVEAEKLRTFVKNVCKHVPNAIVFMERLIDMNPRTMEIPTTSFFGFTADNNENSSKIVPRVVEIDQTTFIARSKSDLMSAHFSAVHIKSARRLLNEILPIFDSLNKVNPLVAKLFNFDSKMLEGYKAALTSRSSAKKPRLEHENYEYDLTTESSKNSHFFRTNADLEQSVKVYKGTAIKIRDDIAKLDRPTEAELLQYQNCSPDLWKLMHTYDFETINQLAERAAPCDENGKKSPFKCPDEGDITTILATLRNYVETIKRTSPTSREFVEVFGYETLRLHLKVMNASNGMPYINAEDHKVSCQKTLQMIHNSMNKTPISWTIQQIAPWYFAFLMNTGAHEIILSLNKKIPDFKSSYYDFARLVITIMMHPNNPHIQWNYLYKLLEMNKPDEQPLTYQQFMRIISMIKNLDVINYLLSFFVSLRNAMNQIGDPGTLPYAVNHPINANIFIQIERSILPDILRNLPNLDIKFMDNVIVQLLSNGLMLSPKNAVFHRQMGDVNYAKKDFRLAAAHYADVLQLMLNDDLFKADYSELVNDEMINKLVHCLFQRQLFTLSAICGQLLNDMQNHLNFVPTILKHSDATNDAEKAYFPFIYRMPLFEVLATVYDLYNMNALYFLALKLCPTRAINQANYKDIVRHEEERRRREFIRILANTCQQKSDSFKRVSLLSQLPP
ncbi:hypothetical protein M3Y96_00252600 [Aphelenchoides besseyi]|nr:hypothetical protein M3Y96_00252600 [Aphelenchoides besseyi]